jgi:hypothetical protein
MEIKVEPFMIKKGNRVGKAAIKFTDGILKDFHLVGFTICDDEKKGLFVLFPASIRKNEHDSGKSQTFFFLRPGNDDQIAKLETAILDVYESMIPKPFNGVKLEEK